MANSGAILGVITVVANVNDRCTWHENSDPTTIYDVRIPAGDYYLESDTFSEDIRQVIAETMESASSLNYSMPYDSAGKLTIQTTFLNTFRLYTSYPYEDSVFTDLGFYDGNPDSQDEGFSDRIEALTPPPGTMFWQTPDSGEEIISDTRWQTERKGASTSGLGGRIFTKTWSSKKDREITYGPLVGPNAFSYEDSDIDWARTCYSQHWSIGKKVRVYTSTRDFDGSTVDGEDNFAATILNDSFDPGRYLGNDFSDWWELALRFQQIEEEEVVALPKGYIYELGLTYVDAETITIGTGVCRDSANTSDITVSSPINIDMDDDLDSGSEANSTWFYIWILQNPTTGEVLGKYSTSSTAPTLTSGYTKYRRLGSVKNDGSGNFLKFYQSGTGNEREFQYSVIKTLITGYTGVGTTSYQETGAAGGTDASVYVPPTAVRARVRLNGANSTGSVLIIPSVEAVAGEDFQLINLAAGDVYSWLPVDINQQYSVRNTNTGSSLSAYIFGYTESL